MRSERRRDARETRARLRSSRRAPRRRPPLDRDSEKAGDDADSCLPREEAYTRCNLAGPRSLQPMSERPDILVSTATSHVLTSLVSSAIPSYDSLQTIREMSCPKIESNPHSSRSSHGSSSHSRASAPSFPSCRTSWSKPCSAVPRCPKLCRRPRPVCRPSPLSWQATFSGSSWRFFWSLRSCWPVPSACSSVATGPASASSASYRSPFSGKWVASSFNSPMFSSMREQFSGAAVQGGPDMGKFFIAMAVVSVLFAIAFAVLFGWIIKRLVSPAVVAEFTR